MATGNQCNAKHRPDEHFISFSSLAITGSGIMFIEYGVFSSTYRCSKTFARSCWRQQQQFMLLCVFIVVIVIHFNWTHRMRENE